MLDVEDQIIKSRDAFVHGAWAKVSKAIGGGNIVPVEGEKNKDFLDKYGGIDHWHVKEDVGVVRGIASRCQWTYKRFETFTIRIGNRAVERTEFAKRIYAMDHANDGWIRPHLFIQAYFDQPKGSYENMRYAGIARMDDILKIIRDGKVGIDWREDITSSRWGNDDENRFAVVEFSTVKRLGFPFRLVEG
jgi:hypothetical protein